MKDDRTMRAYLREIDAERQLTREELIELFGAYHRAIGDGRETQAREVEDLIFRSNLRLVVYLLRQWYTFPHVPFMDLVQEGNFGLRRAIQKFQPSRGVKFSFYASYWIKVRINRALKADLAPVSAVSKQQPIQAFAMRTSLNTLLLLEAATTGEDCDLEAETADNQQREHDKQRIAVALNKLDARERIIIETRLMADPEDVYNFRELGQYLGVSRQRVRQIEVQARAKLRQLLAQPDLSTIGPDRSSPMSVVDLRMRPRSQGRRSSRSISMHMLFPFLRRPVLRRRLLYRPMVGQCLRAQSGRTRQ